MNNMRFYRIIGVLCALIGTMSLIFTALMWLGALLLIPLGFLFDLGEMSNYDTIREDLINLWWHIAPGLAGFAFSLVFMILTALLLWGCMSAWRHSK